MITPITFIWESPLPGGQSTVYNLVYVSILKQLFPKSGGSSYLSSELLL